MKNIQEYVNLSEKLESDKIKDYPWFEVWGIEPNDSRSRTLSMQVFQPKGKLGDNPNKAQVERLRYASFEDALQDCKDGLDMQKSGFTNEHTILIIEQTNANKHKIVWMMTNGGQEVDLRKQLK